MLKVSTCEQRWRQEIPDYPSIELCGGKTIAILESTAQEQVLETISSIGEKSQVLEQKYEQLWQMILESVDKLTNDEQQQLLNVLT